MGQKTILVAGTWDTKAEELTYICDVITAQGGRVRKMDVSVLGAAPCDVDFSKDAIAAEAGSSIAAAIAAEDENIAMQIMALGAARLAAKAHLAGQIVGVIVLGGTMGTDLALDICAALPLGVPKYVVSTVSFSPMIPPDRLAADIQMILWAGGLYGLNAICKAALAQAAGAVLGAARAAIPLDRARPLIGMTSFGKTVLRYMVALKPALAQRGFDLAVFHATGMGGRAFEALAAQGAFAAVMDFAPQEVGNHLFGSPISAGATRLTAAGRAGVPQIVSIGCTDLVDLVGWQTVPPQFETAPLHAHNRLLSSAVLSAEQRGQVARAIAAKLGLAQGECVVILPIQGGNEWDRAGGPLHDRAAFAAFVGALRAAVPATVRLIELDAHINDPAFTDAALAVVDGWIEAGVLPRLTAQAQI